MVRTPKSTDEKLIRMRILKRLRVKERKLVLLHQNADVDSVASAIVLKHYFPIVTIGAPNGIGLLARNFIRALDETVEYEPDLKYFSCVVVVDTSTPVQLRIPASDLKNAMVIDHHTRSDEWLTELYLCDESASSCSELIYDLLRPLHMKKRKLDRTVSRALLGGIITDTGRFRYASAVTFRTVSEIMDRSGVQLYEVLEILEEDGFHTYSRKIAHMKAAQRLEFFTHGEYVVVFSEVSAFEASACNSFVIMGADIAFVGSVHKSGVRLSCRAKQSVVKKGLHLGRFLKSIAVEFDCEAGGHDGAAGLNGTGELKPIFDRCKSKIIDELDGLT